MGGRTILTLALLLITGCSSQEGERAFDDVAVVGLAPGPEDNAESIVQVYAARSYEPLPRMVSVHTWIAYRRANEDQYTIYEAHRFRPQLSGRVVRTCQKTYPDRRWHGADPVLLYEVTGEPADRAIAGIEDAVAGYQDIYRLWPGPNSNTLVAELVRSVDELQVDLPPTAIGKDFLPGWRVVAPAPSGTGWQVSLLGMLGLLAAWEEGVELNLFGAVFGLDLNPPAFKVPVVGRLGFPQGTAPDPAKVEALRDLPRETRCH
ncbi:MAG: DUF3750 domain-containing protein [Pseudomonadota bacterium]